MKKIIAVLVFLVLSAPDAWSGRLSALGRIASGSQVGNFVGRGYAPQGIFNDLRYYRFLRDHKSEVYRSALFRGMQTSQGKKLIKTALELDGPVEIYHVLLENLYDFYSEENVGYIKWVLYNLGLGLPEAASWSRLLNSKLKGIGAEALRLSFQAQLNGKEHIIAASVKNADDVKDIYAKYGSEETGFYYLFLAQLESANRPDLARALRKEEPLLNNYFTHVPESSVSVLEGTEFKN